MRATSSIRSASRCTSLSRHGGTIQPPSARSNPSRSRISSTVSGSISDPSSFEIRSWRREATRRCAGRGYTSTVPGTMRASHSSTIRRAASRWAAIAWSGCSCFSKRADASLRSPSAFEVRMMFGPTQVAASISTRVVVSETSET